MIREDRCMLEYHRHRPYPLVVHRLEVGAQGGEVGDPSYNDCFTGDACFQGALYGPGCCVGTWVGASTPERVCVGGRGGD